MPKDIKELKQHFLQLPQEMRNQLFGEHLDSIDFVKFAIENGVDVTSNNNYAICKSSEDGLAETVDMLIHAGADIHACNNYPLCAASKNGHTKVVKLLLDAGADVRAYHFDALITASANGHFEVVKLLTDSLSQFTCVDIYAFQYSIRLAYRNGYTEIASFLTKKSKDVKTSIVFNLLQEASPDYNSNTFNKIAN